LLNPNQPQLKKVTAIQLQTLFLQVVVVLIGIVVLTAMVWLPLTEGRAKTLSLVAIYSDPLILFVYASSSAFFIALYKGFTWLGYIRQNVVFSTSSVRAIKSIKHCAIILSIFIVIAGIYIRIFHAQDDDPAGFLALCFAMTVIALVVATAMALLEKILHNALDMKAGHDTTL
jgi:hypothetical protein